MGNRRNKTWEDFSRVFVMPPLEPSRQIERILAVERDVVLPVKLVLIVYLLFGLFNSEWFWAPIFWREFIQESLKWFFIGYTILTAIGGRFLLGPRSISLGALRNVVLGTIILDNLFLAALTFITDGFGSSLFWMFLALVVRNALSVPTMGPQLSLQLITNVSFFLAGAFDIWVNIADAKLSKEAREAFEDRDPSDAAVRLILLALTTACCYAVQVLFERQRLADSESREFTLRNEQVKTAGRLAAEIAHQIKNPLAIINNTAWSLQRALKEKNGTAAQQLDIIREEVERSDRIITELMGYAQLAEGRVERLKVTEELDAALASIFPAGAGFESHLERRYASHLPTLLMQRGHLREIFSNLLKNGREAVGDGGHIRVSARQDTDDTVVVTIEDDGPGIPPDKLEQIFEAYYTTKPKGTGLGLAIVRNNMELYGGSVKAESVLGQGARFILRFPARTVLK